MPIPLKVFDIDSISVTGLISAVNQVEPSSGWSVSPNPATGYFDSQILGHITEDMTIRLFNTRGQVMATYLQKESSERFYLRALPAGMYWLTLQRKHETRTVKLIDWAIDRKRPPSIHLLWF